MKKVDITFGNGVNIVYPFIKLEIKKTYTDDKKVYLGRELVLTRPFGQLKRHIDFDDIVTLEVYDE